jgi:hypothetical protein
VAPGWASFLFGDVTVNEIVFVGYDDDIEDLHLFPEDNENDEEIAEEEGSQLLASSHCFAGGGIVVCDDTKA